MGAHDKPRSELAVAVSLLLLAFIICASFGGLMVLQQWRESHRRAQISSNLKQLRLSIHQYQSKQPASTVSE